MFYFDSKDFESNLWQNNIISKKIEIDTDLDCFIIIDCLNPKIITPILNKIVDFIIDNVNSKDTYNKFLVTLESINFFIKTLKNKDENLEKLNVLIWILEKNNFHFSKIWDASVWLINSKNEFLEISDRNTKDLVFDYISSWKISKWDKIIFSNSNYFLHLTENDLFEISKFDDLENILSNIIDILKDEKVENNSKIQAIKYENKEYSKEKNPYLEKTKDIFYKAMDNNFSKQILAYYNILKEKLEKKSKLVKNLLFVSWIIISSFLLFSVISSIVWNTIQTSKNEEYKTNLIQARTYLRVANENITNPDAFELNIKKAEELVAKVKEQKLYLTDVDSILDDISIIKKQFNWIEVFDNSTNNLVFRWKFKDWIKILENNKKLYVLTKNSIYWPIISWQEIKNNIFSQMQIDDEFLDWNTVWDNIIIVTKKSRVIKFNKSWIFSYVNVLWQDTWEGSSLVDSYNLNIYMTNKEWNQIYKHSPSWDDYMVWTPYLNPEDSKNIWKILAIWVDGWIYILKKDLSLLKFFSWPKYTLKSIVLNKLPKSYTLEEWSNPKIVTWFNLNYVYMYLNNKIWIFQPNTKNYADVKSLNYIWQIEWKNEKIKSFYIPRDWEINLLSESWIYKINFEIKDEKLIIR